MAAKKSKSFSGAERRGAERRPVLETFSLFVSVPSMGDHRLALHDLSELGISFDLSTEVEEISASPIKEGEEIDVQFYLNQSLYLDLRARVVRAREKDGIHVAGAEFVNRKSDGYKGLLAFLKMLDTLLVGAKIKA